MDQRNMGSQFWLNWSNNLSRNNRFSLNGPSGGSGGHNNGNEAHVTHSPRLDGGGTPRRFGGRRSREGSVSRQMECHGTPTRSLLGTPRREPSVGSAASNMTRSGPSILYGSPAHHAHAPAGGGGFASFYPSPVLSRSSPAVDLFRSATPVQHHPHHQQQAIYAHPGNANNNFEGIIIQQA